MTDLAIAKQIIEINGDVKRLLGHSNEFKNNFETMSGRMEKLMSLIHAETLARQKADSAILLEVSNKFASTYKGIATSAIAWFLTLIGGIILFMATQRPTLL